MAKVILGNEKKEYPVGTSFREIAKEYQSQYEHDILLASVNGKLAELHKKVTKDCELRFVTTAEKPGMQTYQRN